MGKKIGRPGYSADFRLKALELGKEVGYPRAAAVLGITPEAMYQWKRLPLSGESMSKEIGPELKAALLEADNAKKELKQLKKENEALKTANLILREVATVFSKDPLNPNLGRSLNSNKK
jgi:transposase-like protein